MAKITCKISASENLNFQYDLPVKHSNSKCDPSKAKYLSSLSQELTVLKDLVNNNLSELVDKERALHSSDSKRNDYESSDLGD